MKYIVYADTNTVEHMCVEADSEEEAIEIANKAPQSEWEAEDSDECTLTAEIYEE